jgi:CDP-glucose 4,6-dehydratase
MRFGDAYKGKTVFITGHTGFNGSWLSEWLLLLGANVVGYSLDPPTEPSHFDALRLGERLGADLRADIRSHDTLLAALRQHEPSFIFHLAAQPIVRRAFIEPGYTVETNVMGSVNILEAVRLANRSCTVIMVSTDKVYENVEWVYPYRENDPLGGHDPYSASKASAEILISAYRRSFFIGHPNVPGLPVIAVASARGGNVIGGGDWAQDRIVPDVIRSLAARKRIPVRNRKASRPWQHVLELLSGYLHLGSEISHALSRRAASRLHELCSSFNFGPHMASNRTVEELVKEILKHWPGEWEDLTDPQASPEAGRLALAIDKAYHVLRWQPRWSFEEAVRRTVEWYQRFYQSGTPEPASVRELTRQQILSYMRAEQK